MTVVGSRSTTRPYLPNGPEVGPAALFFADVGNRLGVAKRGVAVVGMLMVALFTAAPALAVPPIEFGGPGELAPPPSRVLMLGDSVGASLGDALKREFAAIGADFDYAGYPATGPLTHQGEFWKAELAAKLDSYDPDYVLIQASGCYALFHDPPFIGAGGGEVVQGSSEFFDQWNAHVVDLIDQVQAHGATAAVLTAPVTGSHALTHRFRSAHNFGYRLIAEATGAVLLDWNQLLAPDARFSETIETYGGELRVREADGIHLTPAGVDLVAAWIAEAVSAPLG